MLHRHKISIPWLSSKIIRVLVFHASYEQRSMCVGKNSSWQQLLKRLYSPCVHCAFFSSNIQSFHFSSADAWYKEAVFFSISLNFFSSQNSRRKLKYKFAILSLATWKILQLLVLYVQLLTSVSLLLRKFFLATFFHLNYMFFCFKSLSLSFLFHMCPCFDNSTSCLPEASSSPTQLRSFDLRLNPVEHQQQTEKVCWSNS